jgi:hypothetical protein
MKFRSILAGASAFIVLATATVARADFMPDGTYQYALRQSSTTIGTSSVAVRRAGRVIGIHEDETLTGTQLGTVQATSDEAVITDSLAPVSFNASYLASGKTTTVRLDMVRDTGAFTVNGERLTVPVRMLPDTQAMAIQDQALVTSFITLPAIAQMAKATAITIAVPTAARTFSMQLDPAAAQRPSGVPVGDVGFNVASPVAFSIWYDPNTGVVDEVDVPSQNLVIALTKRP